MAVPEQIPYVGYIGNGTTTIFPITFHLSDPEYLVVTVNKEIPQTGNYTVDSTNGNVIFGVAPASGAQVELYRETQLNRDTEYKSYNNSFRPEIVNYDFDKVWQVLQEQHMIDAEVLARIKAEIEWRRTHDANFDELSKMRDSQIFSGLKQYLDTILAGANPNIFDGVTAGIVFALDKKSVQTHLEEIATEFEDIRNDVQDAIDNSDAAILVEKNRAESAETILNNKIETEKTRAIQAENLLQNQINANGIGNKAYKTYAAMDADKANIPAKSKVTVTNDTNTSNNGDWQYDGTVFTKSSYDPITQAAIDASNKAEAAKLSAISSANTYTNQEILKLGIPVWVNIQGNINPVLDVDFLNNRVWFNNRQGSITDFFTINGDGSYTLNSLPAGMDTGYTIICQVEADKTKTISGTAFSMINSGNSNTTESYLQFANSTLNKSLKATYGFRGAASSLNAKNLYGNDIYAISRDATSANMFVENNPESTQTTANSSGVYIKPNQFAVGKSLYPSSPQVATNFTIKRVIVYNNALSESDIQKLMTNLSPLKKPSTAQAIPSWLAVVNGKIPSFQYNKRKNLCWFNGAVRDINDVAPEVSTGIRVLKTRPYGLTTTSGVSVLVDTRLPFTWTHQANPISGNALYACNSQNVVQNRLIRSVASSTVITEGAFGVSGFLQAVGDTVPCTPANRPASIGGGSFPYFRGRGVMRCGTVIPNTGGNVLTAVNARPVLITSRVVTAQTSIADYWVLGADANFANPVTNCEVDQVIVYSEALTVTELQQAQSFTPEKRPILFFMGDSFNNLSQTLDATLAHLTKAGFDYIPTMTDGQGGKGLNYQRDLLAGYIAAYPYLADSILIVNEGGFDLTSDTPMSTTVEGPFSLLDIQKILLSMRALFNDKRWIYMHCQTNSGFTAEIQKYMADIKRVYPNAFCDATGLLQTQFGTNAEYEAALTSGATPTAMRSDPIHLSWGDLVKDQSGYYWWGLAIARKLTEII